MRPRLFLPLLFCLGVSAMSPASAGVIEDLFRKLIDQRKSTQSWIPSGLLPQMAHELTKPEIADRQDGLVLGREQYRCEGRADHPGRQAHARRLERQALRPPDQERFPGQGERAAGHGRLSAGAGVAPLPRIAAWPPRHRTPTPKPPSAS
jgi:hypothetical protein